MEGQSLDSARGRVYSEACGAAWREENETAMPATSQHGLDGDRLDGERASKYRAGVGI